MTATTQEPYTFNEIATSFVAKAATYAGRRYRQWGVERQDFSQEILAWLYTPANIARVEKWLASTPQQTTRIYRSCVDVAVRYGEREKAARCGYDSDDILWWTPSMVEATLPLALDDTFDGILNAAPDGGGGKKHKLAPGEGGNLLTSVMDVRQAISASPKWVREVVEDHSSGYSGWDDAIQHLVNQLGGSLIPKIGRRRVITNATALHQTLAQEVG